MFFIICLQKTAPPLLWMLNCLCHSAKQLWPLCMPRTRLPHDWRQKLYPLDLIISRPTPPSVFQNKIDYHRPFATEHLPSAP